jgi:hypothetical protein
MSSTLALDRCENLEKNNRITIYFRFNRSKSSYLNLRGKLLNTRTNGKRIQFLIRGSKNQHIELHKGPGHNLQKHFYRRKHYKGKRRDLYGPSKVSSPN